MTEKGARQLLKSIAWKAWRDAANAHRMYPENQHTFSTYWESAESLFSPELKEILEHPSIVSPDPKPLLSDEEIEKEAEKSAGGLTNEGTTFERSEHIAGFKSCAKWFRERREKE